VGRKVYVRKKESVCERERGRQKGVCERGREGVCVCSFLCV